MTGEAKSNGQGIGGILAGLGVKTEQKANHMLNLRLGGLTITGYRLLDLFGGELTNRQRVAHGRHNNRPPGLAKFESRAGIAGKKYIFHRSRLRLMSGDDIINPGIYFMQTIGKVLSGIGFNYPAGHENGFPFLEINNPVARYSRTRIKTKDTQRGVAFL